MKKNAGQAFCSPIVPLRSPSIHHCTAYCVSSPIGRGRAARALMVPVGSLCAPIGSYGQPMTCRSEEHTSELKSLMRISYCVFCLKKTKHANKLYSSTPIYYLYNLIIFSF